MVNSRFGLHHLFSFFYKPQKRCFANISGRVVLVGLIAGTIVLGYTDHLCAVSKNVVMAADKQSYEMSLLIDDVGYKLLRQNAESENTNIQPILYTVVVYLDGQRHAFITQDPNTEQISTELGISDLDEYDVTQTTVHPVLHTSTLILSHVQYIIGVHLQKIQFDTVIKENEQLTSGHTNIIQKGVLGVAESTHVKIFEDEKLVDSKEINQQIIQQPVSQIIEIGTKPLPLPEQFQTPITENIDGKDITYCQKIEDVRATSYDRNCLGCSGRGITSTGKTLHKGIIATKQTFLPYGTKLYVPGYGYGEIQDTGGGLTDKQVDLGWWDFAEDNAVWSTRYLNIYILCE